MVTEPALGRIRLQWWRDMLDAIYGRAGPAARGGDAAGRAIRRRAAPRPFRALIDAREADLADEPPATLAALEAYARTAPGARAAGAGGAGECGRGAGGRARGRHRLCAVGPVAGGAVPCARQAPLLAARPRRRVGLDLARSLRAQALAGAQPAAKGWPRARAPISWRRAPGPSSLRAALPALLPAVLAAADLAPAPPATTSSARPPRAGTAWRLAWASLTRRY